jgi:hypothetical protein
MMESDEMQYLKQCIDKSKGSGMSFFGTIKDGDNVFEFGTENIAEKIKEETILDNTGTLGNTLEKILDTVIGMTTENAKKLDSNVKGDNSERAGVSPQPEVSQVNRIEEAECSECKLERVHLWTEKCDVEIQARIPTKVPQGHNLEAAERYECICLMCLKKLQCDQCGFTFEMVLDLWKHMLKDHGTIKNNDKLVYLLFEEQFELKKSHLKIQSELTDLKKDQIMIREHLEAKDEQISEIKKAKEESKYPSEIVKESDQNQLKDNMAGNKKKHQCNLCEYSTDMVLDLWNHVSQIHFEVENENINLYFIAEENFEIKEKLHEMRKDIIAVSENNRAIVNLMKGTMSYLDTIEKPSVEKVHPHHSSPPLALVSSLYSLASSPHLPSPPAGSDEPAATGRQGGVGTGKLSSS